MPRSARFEVRVTPELGEAIKQAAGIASCSAWFERAALEKLHRTARDCRCNAPTSPSPSYRRCPSRA